jgi:hypothetical protein
MRSSAVGVAAAGAIGRAVIQPEDQEADREYQRHVDL